MKRILFVALAILPLVFTGCVVIEESTFSGAHFEPKAAGELVSHTYYSLDFNNEHKQPNWVYYRLTYDMINGKAKRKDNFRTDPDVTSGSATPADYKSSGYDRGHLCPAADMKISEQAMSETFFMSNMSPQVPDFNRGKWAALESLVRSYIKSSTDTLYIVTGPVFINNKERIGKNKVTAPGFYYKAIYSPKRGGIGFLMPNTPIDQPLEAWVVSISLIEALTGIDFFYQLEDNREREIEAQNDWWE